MTTSMTAAATSATADRSLASPVRVLGRHGSRITMVGVLLAIVGGLVAWFAYSQATQGQQVVATARHIAYGATITEADLRPVQIPTASTLRVTAWSDLATIVGHVATTDLATDALVAPDAVGAGRRTVDLIVPDTAVDDVAAAAGNDTTLLVLVGSGG